tara:strand:+ start:4317 stop:4838 length:522 start_codon:yes stop_codon:yes gene_type:complete
MGVTLTGKVIKDTYNGLLKFEDNQAVSPSERRITDGFGNDTGIKLGTESVTLLKGYTQMTVSEIESEADGSVLVSKDWVNQSGAVLNSWSLGFDGDGTESVFTFTNPFTFYPVMVQVINSSTGYYLAQGTGFTIRRVNTSSPSASTVTIDFQSPVSVGVNYIIMIQKIAQEQM